MKNQELSNQMDVNKTKRIIEIIYSAIGGLMVSGIFAVLGWGIICGYIR